MNTKQLEPHEYSFGRKRAELEKRDIIVENNQVEEEFKKIISRLDERLSKPKPIKDMSKPKTIGPSNMRIPCNSCGVGKLASQPRLSKLITKYGNIEQLKSQYKCRDCR